MAYDLSVLVELDDDRAAGADAVDRHDRPVLVEDVDVAGAVELLGACADLLFLKRVHSASRVWCSSSSMRARRSATSRWCSSARRLWRSTRKTIFSSAL